MQVFRIGKHNFVTVTLTDEIADTTSSSLNENEEIEHMETWPTQRTLRKLGKLEDVRSNTSSNHHH